MSCITILLEIKYLFFILLSKISHKEVFNLNNPSETKRSAFYNGNLKNSTEFYEWLVGITDGDGTFYFNKNNKGVWGFTFKIGQSNYNLRLLYYIKSVLKVGSISVHNSKDNIAEFIIRDIQHIIQYILPIFDNYPLLTSKHFHYYLFKKAILIMANPSYSKEIKDELISEIKSKSLNGIPTDYVSPTLTSNTLLNTQYTKKVISKYWLIGFTESKGSFYIVNKGLQQLEHAFEIRLFEKVDIIVLEAIAMIFQVKVNKKKTYNTVLVSTNKDIQFIVKYYHKTMKGMKALEYRIWARSFNKQCKNYEYLMKIQNLMLNIRSIRLYNIFNIEV